MSDIQITKITEEGCTFSDKLIPGPRARFASICVERWGMVACIPDGEDSAGRQKMRLATPAELVARATEITEKLFAEFQEREWALNVPERMLELLAKLNPSA